MKVMQCTMTAIVACALAAAPPLAGGDAQAQERERYWDDRHEAIEEDRERARQRWEQRREELDELAEERQERLEEFAEEERFYRDNPRRYTPYYRAPVYGGGYNAPRRTYRYYDPYYALYYGYYPSRRYYRSYTRYYGTPRVGYFRDPWGREGVRVGRFRAIW